MFRQDPSLQQPAFCLRGCLRPLQSAKPSVDRPTYATARRMRRPDVCDRSLTLLNLVKHPHGLIRRWSRGNFINRGRFTMRLRPPPLLRERASQALRHFRARSSLSACISCYHSVPPAKRRRSFVQLDSVNLARASGCRAVSELAMA